MCVLSTTFCGPLLLLACGNGLQLTSAAASEEEAAQAGIEVGCSLSTPASVQLQHCAEGGFVRSAHATSLSTRVHNATP